MKKSHAAIEVAPAVEEYCTKPCYDEDGVQSSSGIGRDGKEYPDPVPLAPPIDYAAPPDLMTLIKTMIRSEQINQRIDEAGFETFEESDDFDLEDDPLDPLTPYEKVFEPQLAAAPQAAVAPPPASEVKVAPMAPAPVQGGGCQSPPFAPAVSTQYVYLIRTVLGDTNLHKK